MPRAVPSTREWVLDCGESVVAGGDVVEKAGGEWELDCGERVVAGGDVVVEKAGGLLVKSVGAELLVGLGEGGEGEEAVTLWQS